VLWAHSARRATVGVLAVGDQHQLLALAAVGDGDDGMAGFGPDGAGQALDGGQGHHLAADLGEALHPAQDGDIALVVDVHDVAGVVPAVLEGSMAPDPRADSPP
jgi:hypothetical protein